MRRCQGIPSCVTSFVKWTPCLLATDSGVKWPHSPGQVGGEDKLSPGCDYAASFRLDAIAGACSGDGVEPIPKYASSGVRPASAEWGRVVL